MSEAILELNDSRGRRIVPVGKERFTVGRQSDNDLQVEGGDVSRHHAEILRENGGYRLRDLGSRFGTFVNDRQITEVSLQHGDRIRLGVPGPGQAEMTFLVDAAAPRPAEPPKSDATITQVPAITLGDMRQMATLLEGLRALGTVRVLEDVLTFVLDAAIESTGAERGFVMLANPSGQLDFKLARGAGRVTLSGQGFETSRKIPEDVFRSGEPQMVPDLLDPGMAAAHPGTVKFGIRAALCAPLRLMRFTDRRETPDEEPRSIGVLYLDSKNRGPLMSPTTRTAIETLAAEAAVAIENARLYRESAEMARIEQELRNAAEIQQSLLPPRTWARDRVEMAGATLPCRAIGGDFFDFSELPNGNVGFMLADVSGKGPPAAMLAMRLQGMLSSLADSAGGPAETLEHLNRALLRRSIAPRFATVAYAVLSPEGRLGACSAGHNPSLLVGRDGRVRTLAKGGLLLGLFEEPGLEEEWTEMEPGETLVLFSDGVTEAMNEAGEQFGEERLATCLSRAPELTAEGTLECLLHTVSEFAGEQPQFDDVTVLVVRYAGS
jgi:serine phosphatase RsbU (regulator of sigma subunit)